MVRKVCAKVTSAGESEPFGSGGVFAVRGMPGRFGVVDLFEEGQPPFSVVQMTMLPMSNGKNDVWNVHIADGIEDRNELVGLSMIFANEEFPGNDVCPDR